MPDDFAYGRPGPVLDPRAMDRIKAELLSRMIPSAMAAPAGGLQMARGLSPTASMLNGPPLLGLRMAPSLYSSGLNGLPPAPTTPYAPR